MERDSSNVLIRRKKAQTQSGLLSGDGRWLVLPSLNGEMILTNLREKRQHRIPKENGGGKTLALTANAKWLLTHRTERLGRRRRISQITRWNLQADTPVADRSLDGVSLPPAVIESSASPLSADGRWLVCLSLRGQRMKGAQMVDLSLTEPKVVAAIPILKRKPLFAMISEQGNWVATVENNQTHLWRWKGDGIAKRPVFSIPGSHPVISRDEKRVAVANRQGAILLYRWTRTGPAAEKPRKLDLGGHLFQIHFTPDNQWLVAAGSQNRIHLWNLAREEKAEVLVAPDSGFTRLALSADGRWIAAGSTSEVHIWDLSQKSIPSSRLRIANIPSFVQTMAFQDSGPGLITDSVDGATRSWALKLTSTLEQAKKQARRSLTPQEKRRYLIPTQPQGVNR